MISCKVCNQKFSSITNTHVKFHNLTLVEYMDRYGTLIRSEETLEKMYSPENRLRASRLMRIGRRNGTIPTTPISEKSRKLNSDRMKRDNPMRNPETVRKALKAREWYVYPKKTLEQRMILSESKRGSKNPRWTGGGNGPFYPLWEKSRREALERDNYKCVDCGMGNEEHKLRYKKGLHVHHEKPFRISKEHNLDDLKTVCVADHIKREAVLIRESKGTAI